MTGQIESIEWWKRPSSSRLIHHGRLIRPFSSPLQQMTHPRLPKQYLLPIKISPPPALFSPNNHYFLKLIRNYGLITSIWWNDPLPISWRKFVRTRRYQKYSLCKFVCQFIEFELNVPRKSPTITSHSSLCFKRTIVNLKPFDSSWTVLQLWFWVQDDKTKRWPANVAQSDSGTERHLPHSTATCGQTLGHIKSEPKDFK